MDALGYAAALLIGLSLGLIGGGGSIITVPVLVYLLGVEPIQATAYSLFVVGATATVGAIHYIRQKLVCLRTALVFAGPSFVAVYLTRRFLLPGLPEGVRLPAWLSSPLALDNPESGIYLTKAAAVMLLFALLMFAAGLSMMRSRARQPLALAGPEATSAPEDPVDPAPGVGVRNYPVIVLEGVLVGTLTGIVGAGGGFLIIPALVLVGRLPIKIAVGTSLVIIAAKSLIGFLGDLSTTSFDWWFLLGFTGLALVGIAIGSGLVRFIPGPRLRRGFGVFAALMSVVILWRELAALF
jgi:hypothetical protein